MHDATACITTQPAERATIASGTDKDFHATAPHKASSTLARGVYHIENIAIYEEYRTRLANVPAGRGNYLFAQSQKFILKEGRTWLTKVSAPQGGSA